MIVLGLTGSIGMGKSTTADLFRRAGIPVHDADATVHALYTGPAVAPIEAAFPGTTRDGVVDRPTLGARVLGDDVAVKRLEAIVHPLVRAAETDFLAKSASAAHGLVVLDIPLLFETAGEKRCDAVVCVSAPANVQRARVLARPGMSEERFALILARQIPDAEKRRRAHFVVTTDRGLAPAEAQVLGIIRACRGMIRAARHAKA